MVELEGLQNKHIQDLQRLGVAAVDIPGFLEGEEVQIESPVVDREEKENITVGPYIKNAKPKMLFWVIQKNPTTDDFFYDLNEIARMRLQNPSDDNFFEKSYDATTVAKSEFASKIIKTSKDKNFKTITEYVDYASENEENEEYLRLYLYMADKYGHLTPEEFKDRIINRFSRTQERKYEQRVILNAKKRIEEKLTPSSIKESQEITLVSKLTKDNTLEKLNNLLLNNSLSIDDINTLKYKLTENCKILAAQRGNRPINERESYKNIKMIVDIIEKLTKSSRGWYESQFQPDRPGFGFLMFVMKHVNSDRDRKKLIQILFSEYIFKVDKNGYVSSVEKK